MSSDRRTARAAGIWFIITFVASIPAALVLYTDVLDHARYIVSAGSDWRIAAGAFLEIILIVANVATAVVLFPILKRQSESIALGYVATRIFEGAMIAVGLISLLAIVTLRQDFEGVRGADTASLIIAGKSLVAVHDWTFLLGPAFCAGFGNGILLGYLMYRSGLVPRRLAMIGLIGGPLALLAATLVLFDAFEQTSGPSFLLTLPEAVWELSLGIYLIVKGFRPSPILTADAAPSPAL
jgi:hypothetical protein